ncbi:MAG: acylphosphatase [Gammaproteobacteria bacterium]|nr:acylphosphatase [Gammaproteobacteria bacterium]
MILCVRCVVSGKVQGVFFRQSTVRIAQAFGITGRVKNLVNGDVEVIACGEKEDIEKLQNWLRQGPVTAQVKNIDCQAINAVEYSDFQVDY